MQTPPPAPPISPDGMWMWNGADWIPNPARPMSGPTSAAPYETATLRAMLVTIFLGANVVAVLLLSAFDIVDASTLSRSSPGETLTTINGLLALLSVTAYYATLIPAMVFFAMWVHRIMRNMPALGAPDPRWRPAGAVWRCFLPFFNFFHPLVSVLDAWRGSSSERRWLDVATRKSMGAPALFAGWWAAWLAAGILSRITFAMSGTKDISTQVAAAYLDLVDNILFICAAGLAIVVVRSVTARQESKNALITSGQLV